MVGLARRKSVTNFMQGNRFTRRLASRFVGGHSVSAAICKSVELSAQKITTSMYYLGEYVESPAAIDENVSRSLRSGDVAAVGCRARCDIEYATAHGRHHPAGKCDKLTGRAGVPAA
jgi:hypothetical protein